MKRFPPNGYKTCNSCTNFIPYERSDPFAEPTCYCKDCYVVGKSDVPNGEKNIKASWIFNCTAALDCPHYNSRFGGYQEACVKAIRKIEDWRRLHWLDYDNDYHKTFQMEIEDAQMSDAEFYRSERGLRFLENLGFYTSPVKGAIEIAKKVFKPVDKKKKEKKFITIFDRKGNIVERYDKDVFEVEDL
jgi:hypothetical protein